MASPLVPALVGVAIALGVYALYRSGKRAEAPAAPTKIKTRGYLTGAGAWVDYADPDDAENDDRPIADELVAPYKIVNAGGNQRPYETDAYGRHTGRQLVLPGEPSNPSAILVGRDHHSVDYQNGADSIIDRRPERDYFERPYQIFNPG